jgi:hypothetical protein
MSLRVHIAMMATPEIEAFAGKTKANWSNYCNKHGYSFTVLDRLLVPNMHLNWSRIELALRILRTDKADWVFLVDADSYVVNPDLRVEELIAKHQNADIIFCRDAICHYGVQFPLNLRAVMYCRSLVAPCAGLFLAKNSSFTRGLLKDWIELANGPLSHLANQHPRNQLVLWAGLYRSNKERIAILGQEILRITSNWQFRRIIHSKIDSFVFHDKRLTEGNTNMIDDSGKFIPN